jgi:hypothetical protein
MALNVQLEALTVPSGTEFPPTVQALLELIAEYEAIVGLENFNGVNFGSTEPSEDDRDKPWFKTDDDGDPLGWFAWNGSVWSSIPIVVASGPTTNRPINALEGQLYLDTDINVQLIFERSQWRTASGSPGDVKAVKAANLAAALTANPGWSQDSESAGRFIAGVSDGSGFEYGDTGGEAEHTLTEDEMPSHTHTVPSGGNGLQADGNASNPAGIVSGRTATVTGSSGGGTAHNNLPPYVCYFFLVKD